MGTDSWKQRSAATTCIELLDEGLGLGCSHVEQKEFLVFLRLNDLIDLLRLTRDLLLVLDLYMVQQWVGRDSPGTHMCMRT